MENLRTKGISIVHFVRNQVLLFKFNLLSIAKLYKQLHSFVVFSEHHCFLLQGPSVKRPLVLGKHKVRLYFLQSKPTPNTGIVLSVTTDPSFHSSVVFSTNTPVNSCNVKNIHLSNSNVFSASKNVPISVWHMRLGHLPLYKLKTLCLFNKENFDFNRSCDVCSKARQHKLPFGHSTIHTSSPFQLSHIDTWGPYNTKTYNNQSYFLTIVDDFSRSTWTHLLSTKSNAFGVIKGFIEMVETQFGKKVDQTIRSNNAFELGSSNEAISYFQQKGIIHQTSCIFLKWCSGKKT